MADSAEQAELNTSECKFSKTRVKCREVERGSEEGGHSPCPESSGAVASHEDADGSSSFQSYARAVSPIKHHPGCPLQSSGIGARSPSHVEVALTSVAATVMNHSGTSHARESGKKLEKWDDDVAEKHSPASAPERCLSPYNLLQRDRRNCALHNQMSCTTSSMTGTHGTNHHHHSQSRATDVTHQDNWEAVRSSGLFEAYEKIVAAVSHPSDELTCHATSHSLDNHKCNISASFSNKIPPKQCQSCSPVASQDLHSCTHSMGEGDLPTRNTSRSKKSTTSPVNDQQRSASALEEVEAAGVCIAKNRLLSKRCHENVPRFVKIEPARLKSTPQGLATVLCPNSPSIARFRIQHHSPQGLAEVAGDQSGQAPSQPSFEEASCQHHVQETTLSVDLHRPTQMERLPSPKKMDDKISERVNVQQDCRCSDGGKKPAIKSLRDESGSNRHTNLLPVELPRNSVASSQSQDDGSDCTLVFQVKTTHFEQSRQRDDETADDKQDWGPHEHPPSRPSSCDPVGSNVSSSQDSSGAQITEKIRSQSVIVGAMRRGSIRKTIATTSSGQRWAIVDKRNKEQRASKPTIFPPCRNTEYKEDAALEMQGRESISPNSSRTPFQPNSGEGCEDCESVSKNKGTETRDSGSKTWGTMSTIRPDLLSPTDFGTRNKGTKKVSQTAATSTVPCTSSSLHPDSGERRQDTRMSSSASSSKRQHYISMERCHDNQQAQYRLGLNSSGQSDLWEDPDGRTLMDHRRRAPTSTGQSVDFSNFGKPIKKQRISLTGEEAAPRGSSSEISLSQLRNQEFPLSQRQQFDVLEDTAGRILLDQVKMASASGSQSIELSHFRDPNREQRISLDIDEAVSRRQVRDASQLRNQEPFRLPQRQYSNFCENTESGILLDHKRQAPALGGHSIELSNFRDSLQEQRISRSTQESVSRGPSRDVSPSQLRKQEPFHLPERQQSDVWEDTERTLLDPVRRAPALAGVHSIELSNFRDKRTEQRISVNKQNSLSRGASRDISLSQLQNQEIPLSERQQFDISEGTKSRISLDQVRNASASGSQSIELSSTFRESNKGQRISVNTRETFSRRPYRDVSPSQIRKQGSLCLPERQQKNIWEDTESGIHETKAPASRSHSIELSTFRDSNEEQRIPLNIQEDISRRPSRDVSPSQIRKQESFRLPEPQESKIWDDIEGRILLDPIRRASASASRSHSTELPKFRDSNEEQRVFLNTEESVRSGPSREMSLSQPRNQESCSLSERQQSTIWEHRQGGTSLKNVRDASTSGSHFIKLSNFRGPNEEQQSSLDMDESLFRGPSRGVSVSQSRYQDVPLFERQQPSLWEHTQRRASLVNVGGASTSGGLSIELSNVRDPNVDQRASRDVEGPIRSGPSRDISLSQSGSQEFPSSERQQSSLWEQMQERTSMENFRNASTSTDHPLELSDFRNPNGERLVSLDTDKLIYRGPSRETSLSQSQNQESFPSSRRRERPVLGKALVKQQFQIGDSNGQQVSSSLARQKTSVPTSLYRQKFCDGVPDEEYLRSRSALEPQRLRWGSGKYGIEDQPPSEKLSFRASVPESESEQGFHSNVSQAFVHSAEMAARGSTCLPGSPSKQQSAYGLPTEEYRGPRTPVERQSVASGSVEHGNEDQEALSQGPLLRASGFVSMPGRQRSDSYGNSSFWERVSVPNDGERRPDVTCLPTRSFSRQQTAYEIPSDECSRQRTSLQSRLSPSKNSEQDYEEQTSPRGLSLPSGAAVPITMPRQYSDSYAQTAASSYDVGRPTSQLLDLPNLPASLSRQQSVYQVPINEFTGLRTSNQMHLPPSGSFEQDTEEHILQQGPPRRRSDSYSQTIASFHGGESTSDSALFTPSLSRQQSSYHLPNDLDLEARTLVQDRPSSSRGRRQSAKLGTDHQARPQELPLRTSHSQSVHRHHSEQDTSDMCSERVALRQVEDRTSDQSSLISSHPRKSKLKQPVDHEEQEYIKQSRQSSMVPAKQPRKSSSSSEILKQHIRSCKSARKQLLKQVHTHYHGLNVSTSKDISRGSGSTSESAKDSTAPSSGTDSESRSSDESSEALESTRASSTRVSSVWDRGQHISYAKLVANAKKAQTGPEVFQTNLKRISEELSKGCSHRPVELDSRDFSRNNADVISCHSASSPKSPHSNLQTAFSTAVASTSNTGDVICECDILHRLSSLRDRLQSSTSDSSKLTNPHFEHDILQCLSSLKDLLQQWNPYPFSPVPNNGPSCEDSMTAITHLLNSMNSITQILNSMSAQAGGNGNSSAASQNPTLLQGGSPFEPLQMNGAGGSTGPQRFSQVPNELEQMMYSGDEIPPSDTQTLYDGQERRSTTVRAQPSLSSLPRNSGVAGILDFEENLGDGALLPEAENGENLVTYDNWQVPQQQHPTERRSTSKLTVVDSEVRPPRPSKRFSNVQQAQGVDHGRPSIGRQPTLQFDQRIRNDGIQQAQPIDVQLGGYEIPDLQSGTRRQSSVGFPAHGRPSIESRDRSTTGSVRIRNQSSSNMSNGSAPRMSGTNRSISHGIVRPSGLQFYQNPGISRENRRSQQTSRLYSRQGTGQNLVNSIPPTAQFTDEEDGPQDFAGEGSRDFATARQSQAEQRTSFDNNLKPMPSSRLRTDSMANLRDPQVLFDPGGDQRLQQTTDGEMSSPTIDPAQKMSLQDRHESVTAASTQSRRQTWRQADDIPTKLREEVARLDARKFDLLGQLSQLSQLQEQPSEMQNSQPQENDMPRQSDLQRGSLRVVAEQSQPYGSLYMGLGQPPIDFTPSTSSSGEEINLNLPANLGNQPPIYSARQKYPACPMGSAMSHWPRSLPACQAECDCDRPWDLSAHVQNDIMMRERYKRGVFCKASHEAPNFLPQPRITPVCNCDQVVRDGCNCAAVSPSLKQTQVDGLRKSISKAVETMLEELVILESRSRQTPTSRMNRSPDHQHRPAAAPGNSSLPESQPAHALATSYCPLDHQSKAVLGNASLSGGHQSQGGLQRLQPVLMIHRQGE